MTTDEFVDRLTRFAACGDAVEWARTRPDAETAWQSCPRGDWLLWLAARAGVDRRVVVLAACDCAEIAVGGILDEGAQLAAIWALDAARRWVRGETDLDEVRAAAVASNAASNAAYAAAYAAASAATVAAGAAGAASAVDTARGRSLALSADLVRERIAWADVARGLAGGEP